VTTPVRRPGRVHQLLGALHAGDAVGQEALAIRALLRAAGFDSQIAAGRIDPALAGEAVPLREAPGLDGPDTAWLYHFSPGSPATALALSAVGPLALAYHNVTPAAFFAGWSAEMTRLALQAGGELRALAARARLALAKSEFSRRDLDAAGFAHTGVLPFVHDLSAAPEASPVLRRLYGDGRVNLLSVGRLVPNKRLEQLLAAFAVLQRGGLPHSRLLLPGSRSLERYALALERRARELRLRDVVFLGPVEPGELRACYELADAYVSLSEHEGYGVPLVEAMLARVPVVARDAGAVAETLAGAGVLIRDAGPVAVAAVVERVVGDAALRAALLAGQERVAQRIRSADFASLLLGALAPVLEAAA
jgi:L-malate glycosyltransferase